MNTQIWTCGKESSQHSQRLLMMTQKQIYAEKKHNIHLQHIVSNSNSKLSELVAVIDSHERHTGSPVHIISQLTSSILLFNILRSQ